MNEAAGHEINPFFIHRYGDSDEDHWTTDGMPGMIPTRIKQPNGGVTGGFFKLKPKRNAVGIVKWNKKKKKKKKKEGAGAHLRDFMHATSMHGLKYAAEKEATWIER